MASTGRLNRVSSELKKTISLLLRSKVKDSKLSLVSITEVEVSKDLSFAKVYYSCLIENDKEYVAKAFDKSKGFFRTSIGKNLRLRIVPNLKFIYDDSAEYGIKMNTIIEQARLEDSKIMNHNEEDLENNYKTKKKDQKIETLR